MSHLYTILWRIMKFVRINYADRQKPMPEKIMNSFLNTFLNKVWNIAEYLTGYTDYSNEEKALGEEILEILGLQKVDSEKYNIYILTPLLKTDSKKNPLFDRAKFISGIEEIATKIEVFESKLHDISL